MFKSLLTRGFNASAMFMHMALVRWRTYTLLRRVKLLIRRVRSQRKARPIIAVALVEHLGDIIASEPIARHVRSLHPDAFIVWVMRPPYREVLFGNPAIDELLSVNCLTEWLRLKHSGWFDAIYDLHINKRICGLCQIPLNKDDGDLSITLTNYYEYGNLLTVYSRCAGVVLDTTLPPELHISSDIVQSIDSLALPAKYIVVHCSSNEAARDWTTEKWFLFLDQFTQSTDYHVIEVGVAPTLMGAGLRKYINMCGRLRILQTAELIRRSTLFIGVDSAPAHIANAVGTPGILIFGHYRRFKNYQPYSGCYGSGRNVELIFAKGPAADVPVEEVMQRTLRRLAKLTNSGT